MIVDEIDVDSVVSLEPKYDPPITADSDAPEAFQIAAEAMKTEALHVHIVDRSRRIEAGQYADDPLDEIRAQFASVVVLEQALETTMPNASDHELGM
jgi:broad specificity phosphatase PhoE